MLNFFTDPYKDELLYSAIARYHFYIGNIDYKDTLEEMFGKRSIIPNLEIGSNLDILCNNLGDRYTSDYFINNHTIFPFYSPFLPKDRKLELIQEIKQENGEGLFTKLGIVAGSICKKDGIYYCPFCAKQDIEACGETYIRREHQLQGVYVCPHEGTELKKYSIDKTNASRIEFIRLDEKLLDLSSIKTIDSRHYEKLYKLSKDAYFLLQADLQNVSKKELLEKYRNLLFEKGLTTATKGVKQRELYEEFINFYGIEFLEIMECSIDNDYEYNWLRVVTRDVKRTVHPIRHLLLINFLNDDIDSFFRGIKKEYYPFGKKPWLCLNKASSHYGKAVVKNLKITGESKTKVPVGTFSCECGFVYSRRGPDKAESDKYKIGRIKSFGHVWEDKLKSYLKEEKYGLLELGRLMSCDPKTILKHDSLFGINYFKKYVNVVKYEGKPINTDLAEQYKETILKTIEENPAATRTVIRDMCDKEYAYFYRNDKEWLYNNLPLQTKRVVPNKTVDWDKRDDELVDVIKDKYKEMVNKGEAIRITKSSIGKLAGILSYLDKRLDKLPKTGQYLTEIIETVEQFQLRRCKNIIDIKIRNDENIRLWEIQRIAGIRTIAFEKLKIELEKYIFLKTNEEAI